MKLIKKAPTADPPEIKPPPAPVAEPDTGLKEATAAMLEVVEVAREVIADMANTPEPKKAPTSFRCTVTERDTKGRIKTMDIEVKE